LYLLIYNLFFDLILLMIDVVVILCKIIFVYGIDFVMIVLLGYVNDLLYCLFEYYLNVEENAFDIFEVFSK